MKTHLFSVVLKFSMAVLFMASASLVGAQNIHTVFSFNNNVQPNGLTLGNNGNFFGTTVYGGVTNAAFPIGMGTVFKVTTNGTLTTLYSFTNGIDGVSPQGALTMGNDSNFCGITESRGGNGTIFKVTTNGTLATLYSFTNYPYPGGLTLAQDGNFYGTTLFGGNYGDGAVFQVATNGSLTTLYSFTNGIDGFAPRTLTQGNDGNFYGTTGGGGDYGDGTIFKVTTNGTLSTLVSFNGTNGEDPFAAVTFGNDGNLYGTTLYGGIITSTYFSGMGTVFQLTTNGTLTSLLSFNYSNGASPGGLTLGNDGRLYGTTYGGGSSGNGTVFQLTTSGTVTTLYSFTDGMDGGIPNTALTLGDDGNFYGTTQSGGSYGNGTVFRFLLAPTITFEPQSQTINAGATVTFTVSATSIYPMNFQWQKNSVNLTNGGNISGVTNSTLTIANVSDADAANYSAVVSDAYSGVATSNATLTVNDSLFFAAQPLSQMVRAGSMVSFTAIVYGAPPFVFQWSFNQRPIGSPTTGTNSSSFTLTNVGTNQAGNYSVEVFNGTGNLTSSNAVLTVIVSPTLALQILAGYPLVSLYGTLGNNYVVEYSTNLADTNWQTLLSLTNLPASPYQFLDPSGVGQPARFYRAYFTQ